MQSVVILDGVLDLKRMGYYTPIDCHAERPCNLNKSFVGHLYGWASQGNSATSWHSVEHTMERLNGRRVRLTVEFEPPFSEESATTGQQHDKVQNEKGSQ